MHFGALWRVSWCQVFFFLCRPASRCTSCKKLNTPSLDSQRERRWDARLVPKNTPRKQAGACPRGTGSLRLNPAHSCQQKHVLGVTGMGIALCDQCGVNPSHQQAGLGKGCQHCSPPPSTVLGIPSLMPLGFIDLISSMASPHHPAAQSWLEKPGTRQGMENTTAVLSLSVKLLAPHIPHRCFVHSQIPTRECSVPPNCWC